MDDFNDVHLPEPTPFGDASEGVQLRIRPAKRILATGDSKSHVQAVNVGGTPVVWRMPNDKIGANVVIKIDGQAIEPTKTPADYCAGWAAKHTRGTPWYALFRSNFVPCEPG